MGRLLTVLCATAGLLAAGPVLADRADPGPSDVPAAIQQAIADPARADAASDDARRKPAAVLTFAGVAPGDTVIELIPGSGYWTAMFSAIVGKEGHVVTVVPTAVAKKHPDALANIKKLAADPHYDNVEVVTIDAADLDSIEAAPADLIFTAQNLHDFANAGMGHITPKAFATEVKPLLGDDGVLLINDHAAARGTGLEHTGDLHRIDPALVKKQIVAAGYRFDGASDALANPDDAHDKKVFDEAIQGHTDEFIYRFVPVAP
ncbi:methyltransferase [uncultured Salinisphaera sp.]|uniref:methyltransferase n=1 Tax=uncultured Salinisphaera sp. TaxID=359372 RepID=UPI0032B2CEB6|tara:strand:- start:5239 stop:6024 length:786 start_codon:yes stop_codon:yes gene_type:complete